MPSKTQPAACFLWPRTRGVPGFISSALAAVLFYGRAVPPPGPRDVQGGIMGLRRGEVNDFSSREMKFENLHELKQG